jgi:hypothetical protein
VTLRLAIGSKPRRPGRADGRAAIYQGPAMIRTSSDGRQLSSDYLDSLEPAGYEEVKNFLVASAVV